MWSFLEPDYINVHAVAFIRVFQGSLFIIWVISLGLLDKRRTFFVPTDNTETIQYLFLSSDILKSNCYDTNRPKNVNEYR